MILYHYTCRDHGAPGIERVSLLRPWPQLMLGGVLLTWLTDLDAPDRRGLGLGATLLTCDRAAVRVTVDAPPAHVTHWHEWAHARQLPRDVRDGLEIDGALPAHWWVTEHRLPVAKLADRYPIPTKGATR